MGRYQQAQTTNPLERNWIDLRTIRATERVTHQRQPSWLNMKMPYRRSHRALLCSVIVLIPPHVRYMAAIGRTRARIAVLEIRLNGMGARHTVYARTNKT